MREETCTKWRQEYEANSNTKTGLEDQLQRLINAVADSSTTVTTTIRESNHEEFGVVRSRLESIFYVVSNQLLARPLLQDSPSISIELRVRNVQVLSTVIDANNEEVH